MKLKTFTATSMPQAMNDIRQVFGENAVIVSSLRCPDNTVRLIVAAEDKGATGFLEEEKNRRAARLAYFKNLLEPHGVPESYYERLLNAISRKSSKLAEEKWLAAAFEELYVFKSIEPLKKNGLYVFLGAAGCGKTTAVAKAAYHAKLNKLKVACITLDKQKACGAAELARYAGWMNISCTYLNEINKLNETVTMLRLSHDVILIDTPALNPYLEEDLEQIHAIKMQLSDAEMIYVQAAGTDYVEARMQGAFFAKGGCTVLLGTKLDLTRRYGGLLECALFGSYQWGGWSKSNKITDYLLEAGSGNLNNIMRGILSKREDD